MVGLGLDIVSGIAVSASSLGNIGPGLGIISDASFRNVPLLGRLFMAFFMWIGRLEIFTAIVAFSKYYHSMMTFDHSFSFQANEVFSEGFFTYIQQRSKIIR